MIKKIILFALILNFCGKVYGQINLIPDSSFENNQITPLVLSGISASSAWSSPTRATPDLFCKCDKKQAKLSEANVPNNPMGEQEALSGKCYAGIFCISHGYYREYIQATLNNALMPDKEYTFRMYVSLSDYSTLAADKIGVSFLTNTVSIANSDVIEQLQPHYMSLEEEVGIDTQEWHELTYRYKAKGGETVVLIGCFGIKRLWKTGNAPPPNKKTPIYKKFERDAYYYIDNVSMYEYKPEVIDTNELNASAYFDNQPQDKPEEVIVSADTVNKIKPNEVITLKNVLFKSGKDILTQESYNELIVLLVYLKSDPKLKVEIYGHTDNSGSEDENLNLSAKRAKAVGDFLVLKGINSDRIVTKGFGSSQPLQSNASESGRLQNRRVEFMLVK